MGLKGDSFNDNKKLENLGIKVEGDLGELQIVESTDSECSDYESSNNSNIKSGAVQTVSSIPSNLIQTGVAPFFNNIAVNNSEHVQFGHNTYFHGPVTIKQVIRKKGVENASYTPNDNENEHGSAHTTPAKPAFAKNNVKKYFVPFWVKVFICIVSVLILGMVCALALYIQSHSQDDGLSNSDSSASNKETNFTKVVGMSHDSLKIMLFTIIVVPITIMLMLYLLLTSQHMEADIKLHKLSSDKHSPMVIFPDGGFNSSVEPSIFKADPLLIAPNQLRIVSRTDWLAQPVEKKLDKIRLPVPWVIITHTATEGCYNQSQCVLRVRLIQTYHIESRNWDDIGYNFLVAGDGSAYFGRGWDNIGAHTLGYNKYSIGIAFIGTFNNEVPPRKQIEACKKLIKLGVQLGKIAKDYKLFAHRQLASTLSPGDKLYEIIKEWPHFVKEDSNLEELTPRGY